MRGSSWPSRWWGARGRTRWAMHAGVELPRAPLHAGVELSIVEERPGWYLVRLRDLSPVSQA